MYLEYHNLVYKLDLSIPKSEKSGKSEIVTSQNYYFSFLTYYSINTIMTSRNIQIAIKNVPNFFMWFALTL